MQGSHVRHYSFVRQGEGLASGWSGWTLTVVARCNVERLMRQEGLQGVRRGKAVRATVRDPKAPCPLDRVNRQFRAEGPNQLWISDFTYVSTRQGWVYVAL